MTADSYKVVDSGLKWLGQRMDGSAATSLSYLAWSANTTAVNQTNTALPGESSAGGSGAAGQARLNLQSYSQTSSGSIEETLSYWMPAQYGNDVGTINKIGLCTNSVSSASDTLFCEYKFGTAPTKTASQEIRFDVVVTITHSG